MTGGYDDATDVLTKREGWKPWPEIDGSEALGTVNPSTGSLEYRRATAVYHDEVAGPMYRVRSEQVDLLVGADHPLWVQRYDTRAAKRGEQPFGLEWPGALLHKRVRYDKTAKWLSGTDEDVVIPPTRRGWTRSDNGARCTREYQGRKFAAKPFARFLGYYLAEGSVNGHQIVLAQNRGPLLDAMVGTVRELGLPPYVPSSGYGCVRTSCVALRDFLVQLGHAVDKRLPDVAHRWTPEVTGILLDAVVDGDGTTHRGNGHRVIYTVSGELAGGLQVLAIKAGISANVRVDDRTGLRRVMPSGQTFRNLRPTYVVSLVAKRNRPLVNHGRGLPSRYWNEVGRHDSFVPYSGGLHSAAVPNGLLLVRRNGKVVVCGDGASRLGSQGGG